MDIAKLRAAVLAGASDLEIAKIAAGRRPGRHVEGILYQGPSRIDGKPIMVIVTGSSKNPKTGPMLQVWILRSDMHPAAALKTGDDVSICGHCPHRPDSNGKNRSCYVNIMSAGSVYKKFVRGGYKPIAPSDLAGQAIRWGAYGDPAAMPVEIFNAVNELAEFWTGYTHQWHTAAGADFVGSLMASVDTPQQERRAAAQGWGTFRVGLVDGSDKASSDTCPAEATDKAVTCMDCKKCDGRRNANVYVAAHGKAPQYVPAERLARRAA